MLKADLGRRVLENEEGNAELMALKDVHEVMSRSFELVVSENEKLKEKTDS